MNIIQLGSYLLGFSIALEGIGLLQDPWAQEIYERSIRECGRLDNRFLMRVEAYLSMMPIFAIFLIISGFSVMNRIIYAKIPVCFLLGVYGLIYYTPTLYFSPKIGGERIILGFLQTCAKISLIWLAFSEDDNSQNIKLTRQQQRQKEKYDKIPTKRSKK